jgi:type II secretion system protein N
MLLGRFRLFFQGVRATLCGVKKLSKAILIGLAVLVALGVALAVFANIYIQSPASQARIQEELSKALRLPFKLTNVSVSPFGNLKISGITIPNGDANFFEAASFNAHYKWLPLLHGKLVITEMNVQNPKVIWAQSADGKWKLPEPEQAAKAASEETNPASPITPEPTALKPPENDQPKAESDKAAEKKENNFKVVVERFDVKGGTVELLDNQNKHLAIFNDVNMTYTTLTPERVEGVATIGKLFWADTFAFENVSTPFKYAEGALELPEITAAFAGGKLQAKYRTREEKEHSPYKVAVTFINIDLDQFGTPNPSGQAQASGSVTGQLEVHGDGKVSDRLNGEAHVDLRNAQFHQLDFFQSIGQLLGLRELADLRVRDGHTDLRLADNKVLVEKLVLNTSDLQISAHGTARLDKHLNLSAELSAEDSVVEHLPEIIRNGFGPSDGGRRAVAFNITGDLDKPKTDLFDKFVKRKVDSQFTDVLSSIFSQVKKPEDPKKDDKKADKERRKKDKDQNAATPSPANSAPATPTPPASPSTPIPAATPAPPQSAATNQ